MAPNPHIVGLGNALVDVVAPVDHDVIARHGLTHGGMHLVDEAAAQALFEEVAPGVRQSGGSVANSIAHAADIGLMASYIGKTAMDDLGESFREDMAGLGVANTAPPATDGPGTGRCVVLVTPDGERTMSTFLGAATGLAPSDVEVAFPASADVLLVEGYVWDAPQGAEAIAAAAARARSVGAQVAISPSDPGCAERNREAMTRFVEEEADVLLGNHLEVCALAGCASPAEALDWAIGHVAVAAVTESEKGSRVADRNGVTRIQAAPTPEVIDSTGAGDAYAAAFLGALARGLDVGAAGRAGARKAAGVLGHFGARRGAAAEALSLPAA